MFKNIKERLNDNEDMELDDGPCEKLVNNEENSDQNSCPHVNSSLTNSTTVRPQQTPRISNSQADSASMANLILVLNRVGGPI